MKPVERFVYDRLMEGQWLATDNGWNSKIAKRDLYTAYCEASSIAGVRRKGWEGQFAKEISKIIPKVSTTTSNAYNTDADKYQRISYYVFPDLSVCRQSFEQYIGSAIPWSQIDDGSDKTISFFDNELQSENGDDINNDVDDERNEYADEYWDEI